MKKLGGTIRLSATDLSHHLSCGRLTALDLEETRGERVAPEWRAPDLVVIQQRGLEHERAYVARLAAEGLELRDLSGLGERATVTETLAAMATGVDVIVQGALQDGQWFGRPDVLRKASGRSQFGGWLYEPYDCKLTRETKAATILQLVQYAALLTAAQGTEPKSVYVVPASKDFSVEPYRVLDYAAFYRMTRRRLEEAVTSTAATYPEPNGHCDVCRWWPECDRQWRQDDHLSLTAGIRRAQRKQLEQWEIQTMAALAQMTVPLTRRPDYGSKEGYVHVREQANVQVTARRQKHKEHKLCPIEEGRGFLRLPEPSVGDVFFDLETSRFTTERGLEYLFGYGVCEGDGTFRYEKRWALNAAEEREAFTWFVDLVMKRWEMYPDMHVYHYGHKEASTLRSLMGWYATREEQIDRMLRGGLLVDLLAVTKQALWASVEQYSLKALEEFHGYRRAVGLDDAGPAMRRLEHDLEMGRAVDLASDVCQVVTGYNEDDCHSTLSLRDWLEKLRAERMEEDDVRLPRPVVTDGAASDQVHARQERVDKAAAALKQDVSEEPDARTEEQASRWLLADLLDWHWREMKVASWEKYRLQEMNSDQLMDEREAIAELKFVREIAPQGRKRNWTHEYSFPPQETSLEEGDAVYSAGQSMGTVVSVDVAQGLVKISKKMDVKEIHPECVYSYKMIGTDEQADSLMRFAEAVIAGGFGADATYITAEAVLRRIAPSAVLRRDEETAEEAAIRLTLELKGDVLAIQGPPGAGKTYTAAAMILRALAAGRRVGVTANSHKVIVNLLEDVHRAAEREGRGAVRCLQKVTDKSTADLPNWLSETKSNAEAAEALRTGSYDIVAGTAWLWARPEFAGLADLLFVDEAGQMSLANALAIAPATRNVVLLGDPQQLEQPVKGSHPEGAGASALEHLLRGEKTMKATQGLFLDKTWRLHPEICQFTSELFYENLLEPQEGLGKQKIEGHGWLGEAGIRYLAVEHDGNQNSSMEEVQRIVELVESLLTSRVYWVDREGVRSRLGKEDILVVAPYNSQVSLLARRLPAGMRVGTVDKFQGQQAPVVIYSLTTSTAEDAPRGMEFLYSLNRFNVATSRARAMAIVVGSPRLLDAQCSTPRQLRLANALCRYVEMARREEGLRTVAADERR